MAEVSIVLDGLIQCLIQNLNQGSHIGKVLIHLVTIWKIAEYELNHYILMLNYTIKEFLNLPKHPFHKKTEA